MHLRDGTFTNGQDNNHERKKGGEKTHHYRNKFHHHSIMVDLSYINSMKATWGGETGSCISIVQIARNINRDK